MTAATGPSEPSASHDSADAFEDASRPSPTPEASGPLPQASSSRDAWAREAARIRRKVTEEARTVASDVQRESIERGERLSRAARERVDAALAEAGGLLGTDASAETLALLASSATNFVGVHFLPMNPIASLLARRPLSRRLGSSSFANASNSSNTRLSTLETTSACHRLTSS